MKRSSGEYRGRVQQKLICGIDGEGQGRNPHLYTLLCVSDAEGTFTRHVFNPAGLSTKECFEFLLSLPRRLRLFAYSFNYDLTKILKDLPDQALYMLFRPETRKGKHGPKCIRWEGYRLNLVGTKFSINGRVVWDIWKFFRGKFVSALRDWKVGTNLDFMERMKNQRHEFDKLSHDDILRYCLEECAYMARLAAKIIEAHINAGLPLHSFYGAGSTASVILDQMNIKELRGESPNAMSDAVARAFVGGRFEHTVVGRIEGPVFSFDISSAYPYQTCFLPCLVHANWTRTRDEGRMRAAHHACVRYSYSELARPLVWAPFPFRDKDGSILFPDVSGGGWVWRDEYLWGERLFEHVKFQEAWVLESNCDCPPPFAATAEIYKQRLKLGKDTAGTVLKLGMNSEYGKLAQSTGSAPYQSWIWAGMITSGTRAQILEFLSLHRDPRNMLMVATDGVFTREDIAPPEPRDTGTFNTPKPLGAWERKVIERGVFAARPGVYFPIDPTDEETKEVKARGISKSILYTHARRVQDAWDARQPEVVIQGVVRFVGAKSATVRHRDLSYHRTDSYGEWESRNIALTFNPLPKRAEILPDNTLSIRSMSRSQVSAPYSKSLLSPDAVELKSAESEADEQPDGGDWVYYDAPAAPARGRRAKR